MAILRIVLIIKHIHLLARFWQLLWRMKMKIAIITFALACTGTAGAQQEWSLDRCISYAIEHATEVGRDA